MSLTYNVWKYLLSIITRFRLFMTAPAFPAGLRRPGTEAHVRRTLSSSMFLHAASRCALEGGDTGAGVSGDLTLED